MQEQIITKERPRPIYRRNMLELGVKDGISVSHNDEGYLIQMPDRYPLQFAFIGKNKPGQLIEKVAPLDETQKIKDCIIFISLDELSNPKTLEKVGNAIANARKTNIEIQDEIVKQDCYQNAWKMNGLPYDKVATPKSKAMDGEIISVGKYFVSFKLIDDQAVKAKVAIIPTHRILKFEDGDFRDNVDMAERVKQKLGIDSKDFSGGDIKDGIKKTFHFDQKGNCTIIGNIGEKDLTKLSVPIDINFKKTKSQELTMN